MNFSTPEQFAASSRTSIEASLSLASLMFAGVERLIPLSLNMARDSFEEIANGAKTALTANTPQELAGLQAALSQSTIEKLLAYSRSVSEIGVSTQGELTKLMDAQLAQLSQSFSSALDTAARNAPAGSEVAIAAVKSALLTASASYDSANKSARQFAETAVSNATAATDAAVKAAVAGIPKLTAAV
jgi:phasin family protein